MVVFTLAPGRLASRPPPAARRSGSVVWQLPLVVVDGLLQGDGVRAVDGAAHGVGSAKDLLAGALELLGQALGAHLADDAQELRLRKVSAVLDVLDLLTVAHRLLELLDDQASGIRLDVNLRRTVLNGELDRHTD